MEAIIIVLSLLAAWIIYTTLSCVHRYSKKNVSKFAAQFKDKVVWITGASSGIGEELAYQFSSLGAKVIISARREAELLRVKQACADPSKVAVLPLDLAELEALPSKAKQALAFFGAVDVLVNNGGLSTRAAASETLLSVDTHVMNVNYFSAIVLSKAVLPSMLERGSGTLVAISSLSGKFGVPLRTSYCASKHALHGFFDALRCEVHDRGVGVLLVTPGHVRTNLSLNAMVGDGNSFGRLDENNAGGLSAEFVSREIVYAIAKKEEEIAVAKPFQLAALYLKRLLPGVLSWQTKKYLKKQQRAMERAVPAQPAPSSSSSSSQKQKLIS